MPLCKIEALGEKRSYRLSPPATRTRAHNLPHRGEFLFGREEVLNPVGGSQLLFHLTLGRFRGISGLDELVHSDEGFLEVVEGGGVKHLLLDLGRVWAPVHQEQLLLLAGLSGALALVLVLEVVEPVPALALAAPLQARQEVVVAGVPVALVLHRDHPLVLDVEDGVAVALRLLDLLEDGLALVSYRHTGRHGAISCRSESSNKSL